MNPKVKQRDQNVSGKMPPGKLPPPPKKYFVKLLHVMEYLSGENFVNFNFRLS